MDIKQIQYFIQVCEEKNFSKAAEKLFITQQGLSKSIQASEQALGVELFQRSAKGVCLTVYGKAFESDARQMLVLWEHAKQNLSRIHQEMKASLCVYAALGVFNALSLDFLTFFQKTHPNIELKIIECADLNVESALKQQEPDIALSIGPLPEGDFQVETLATFSPYLLVNERNPLYSKKSISFKDLQNEPIILVNETFRIYHNFLSQCKKAGVNPNIILTTAELIMIHKMAQHNKAVGLTLDFIVKDFNYTNARAIPFEESSFKWEVCMAIPNDRLKNEAVKCFREALKAWVEDSFEI